MLLNSLNVRTFAAAIKILLCCETFWTDLFAKLSTAAPTRLGKKNKTRELYCLVNFASRGWLSRFKFFKGLLFIGGRERRKEDPHQARPQSLLVFQYGSRRHIGKRKDPGGEVAS